MNFLPQIGTQWKIPGRGNTAIVEVTPKSRSKAGLYIIFLEIFKGVLGTTLGFLRLTKNGFVILFSGNFLRVYKPKSNKNMDDNYDSFMTAILSCKLLYNMGLTE